MMATTGNNSNGGINGSNVSIQDFEVISLSYNAKTLSTVISETTMSSIPICKLHFKLSFRLLVGASLTSRSPPNLT